MAHTVAAFALPEQFGPIELEPIGLLVDRQGAENPQIDAARASERISKLESDRIRAQMLPTLSASATMTRRQGVDSSFVGLSVNALHVALHRVRKQLADCIRRRLAGEPEQTGVADV